MVKITTEDLEIIFLKARTLMQWQDKEVPDTLLQSIYDIAKTAPTAANCQPMRVLFLKSKESKEKLKPCLAQGNVKKTMSAPVTAVIAGDTRFYEHLPFLFPFSDMRGMYENNPAMAAEAMRLNTALQGAYLMIAARSLGLDCGPMSGFDAEKTDAAFFPEGRYKSLFLCNLGYGDWTSVPPRAPRLTFEEACQIIE